MENSQKLYVKAGLFLALSLCPIYLAIWYHHIIVAYILLTALVVLCLFFVTKVLHSNTKLKNELRTNLYIDLNTRLPNRLKLLQDKKKLDPNIDSTLIIINIDSFQNTNNFYGHNFGDKFLKTIGEWLSNNLPPVDATLYKFEADVYAILIRVPFNDYNLKKYLKKISMKITKDRIICDDVEVDTTLSIGAFQGKKNLLKLASIACKEAKNKRLPYMVYDKSSHKEAEYHHNMMMNHTLKEALAKDYVVPFFQPILNLHTNEIEKFETLMRIKKENGSYYLPAEFLDVAKHSKIYSKLSMSLIQKAFETFQISSNGFSINLSYLDMTNLVTTTFIIEKLEEFSVGPWVIFEILESDGIENYEAIAKFIDQVKSYGAKIAIDDFGSGYSNFERLTELRVDYIKIDGSLIKNIHQNEETKIIAKTIVSFAKELNIKTIAEYVHSEEVLACVKEIGIDYAQGFHIGKPNPEIPINAQ
ncbi:EAL domain-containing protein [Sulfurospirillum oryzae]|uniref:EAL domain-containing protein n=1 Tax=Sulfurospirillum oryzae TaxID=2976535 RepID=UPI0021E72D14|nr:GGDEF domain-containing phosphodiesterase [Sulfurospirillum oryzae]